jgi:cystathionine gamma-synthase
MKTRDTSDRPGIPIPAEPLQRATRAVRAGIGSDAAHGAVMPPIYLSTNFTFDGFDAKRRYDYTRSGNPTRDALATALAAFDGGAGATVTSSGMAAIDLLCHLLGPHDLLLAPHDCYGGTYRLLDALARKGHFPVLFVDQTDPLALGAAFARRPRLVLIESPSNPLLRITDIAAVCRLAKQCDALVAADNTFLSPVLQRPLELGADFVIYSTTKYLNGHSDVVGGAVVSRSAELAEQIDWWANCLGVTGAPFDSYLTLRGLRTLELRIAQHERNARAIVELLAAHPAVARVYYPGLGNHPGHALATRQQHGCGAMVSFELLGGTAQVRALLDGLQCFSLAESLGGVESLIAHPATMTHAAMDPEVRRRAGIGNSLLRLSVGIEAAQDLVEDLHAGLQRAAASLPAAPRRAAE